MSTSTKIEWTNATWNPVVGCTKVSEGCRHCYAMIMAGRIANAAQRALRDGKTLTDIQAAYRQVVKWERGGKSPADEHDKALPQWNGRVALIESRLTEPLHWRTPRLVFVNSEGDLFHPEVPAAFVDRVLAAMALTPRHTYQVLTKRPERMAEHCTHRNRAGLVQTAAFLLENPGPMGRDKIGDWFMAHPMTWPLPNVWLGTSVENQRTADGRSLHLKPLSIEGWTVWWSAEPLLGGIFIPDVCYHDPEFVKSCWLDWIVVGGESGHGARPMHPEWARSLRDQCEAAKVPFFFKQWGEWASGGDQQRDSTWCKKPQRLVAPDGRSWTWDEAVKEKPTAEKLVMYRVGKHAAGRLLDGREWNDMPVREAVA